MEWLSGWLLREGRNSAEPSCGIYKTCIVFCSSFDALCLYRIDLSFLDGTTKFQALL